MKSRPVSSSGVTGLTCATAFTQPVSSASGTYTGAMNSRMKTGICIAGPAWIGPQPHRDAGREQRRRERGRHGQPHEPHEAERSAVDLHPADERDDEEQHPGQQRAHERPQRVAGEDARGGSAPRA